MKYIKTIKQARGQLKIAVFPIGDEIAYDVIFTHNRKAGESFATESHNRDNGSPLINHEIIIAKQEYSQINENLKNSGLTESEYFKKHGYSEAHNTTREVNHSTRANTTF